MNHPVGAGCSASDVGAGFLASKESLPAPRDLHPRQAYLSYVKPAPIFVPTTLPRSPDAIVIGGGLIGCSTAYHLAKTGVRALLIEQGDLASGASGANFGNVQVQDAELGLSLELTLRSYAKFAALEAELDSPVGYRASGSLLLIETERQWDLLARRAEVLHAAGLRVELLDRAALRQLEPQLAPDAAIGALYHPAEGTLDPCKLVHAYARRGCEQGLEVWTHTEVRGIQTRDDRVIGVETGRGPVSAQWVVLAAGAWTRGLGRTVGLDLPLRWVHGEALITEPLPPLTYNAMSSAAFFEATESAAEQTVGFCLRQRPRGNVMLGEAAFVTDRLSRRNTAAALPAIASAGRRRLPALRRAAILRAWAIPVAFVADSRPLLGPVEGVAGLVVAAGLKSTIILTPLVGERVAALMTGGEWDPRLAEFAPSRTL